VSSQVNKSLSWLLPYGTIYCQVAIKLSACRGFLNLFIHVTPFYCMVDKHRFCINLLASTCNLSLNILGELILLPQISKTISSNFIVALANMDEYITNFSCLDLRPRRRDRVPVTSSTLYAYAAMRGNSDKETPSYGPLHDALYIPPKTGSTNSPKELDLRSDPHTLDPKDR